MKTMGTSVNGSICFLMWVSNALVVLVSFSTKSHLFTKITTPLLLRWANQIYSELDHQNLFEHHTPIDKRRHFLSREQSASLSKILNPL